MESTSVFDDAAETQSRGGVVSAGRYVGFVALGPMQKDLARKIHWVIEASHLAHFRVFRRGHPRKAGFSFATPAQYR